MSAHPVFAQLLQPFAPPAEVIVACEACDGTGEIRDNNPCEWLNKDEICRDCAGTGVDRHESPIEWSRRRAEWSRRHV